LDKRERAKIGEHTLPQLNLSSRVSRPRSGQWARSGRPWSFF